MDAGIIIYGSIEQVSGGYLYDRKLVEYLRRQGDNVEIISIPRHADLRQIGDNFSQELYERIKRAAWDVLLQDELNHPSLFLLNERLRARMFPIVSIVHHLACYENPGWVNQLVETRYLNSVDGFIFNSMATKQAVEGVLGRESVSIVAYPGKNNLAPEGAPADRRRGATEPLRLVFTGNVIRRKGLHVLVEALAQLKDVPWQLRIAGDMSQDKEYTEMIRAQLLRQGIDKRVEFLGQVTDNELSAALLSSHLLVMPSLYEGLGIAYLEAMGHGVPVIASSAGGAGEIIDDGEEGFLVDPGDTVTLGKRIRRLAQDSGLLTAMAKKATERFSRALTWDETGSVIRDFLNVKICSAPGAISEERESP